MLDKNKRFESEVQHSLICMDTSYHLVEVDKVLHNMTFGGLGCRCPVACLEIKCKQERH